MIRLIVDESYRPTDRQRAAEIVECRERNRAAGCELVSMRLPGVEQPDIGTMFAFASVRAKPGENWAIANADVCFDRTLAKVDGRRLGLAVLALTRREDDGQVKPNAWHSQDAWIFEPRATEGGLYPMAGFGLGRYACDNRLAFELAAAGRHVFNPCGDIRVHHLHARREVNDKPWVPGPYMFCPPVPLAIALAMGKPQGPR